jgi:hypothetical protein
VAGVGAYTSRRHVDVEFIIIPRRVSFLVFHQFLLSTNVCIMAAPGVGAPQAQVTTLQVRQAAAAKDEARTLASIGEAQQRLQVGSSTVGPGCLSWGGGVAGGGL